MLVTRGLERVLADLTAMGYDSRWGIVSAADIGAPHRRERIWILANTKLHGLSATQVSRSTQETVRKQQAGSHNTLNFAGTSSLSTTKSDVAYTVNEGSQGWLHRGQDSQRESKLGHTRRCSSTHGQSKQRWWTTEPNVGRVADGVAARVDRLKAIGNGQVPLCAATAWELLK
jgi:DNA (cytosine-5)-methyltransferase 1